MTTNISRETGRLSLLLRSPAKFEPYALPSPPLSLFSILDEDFIQVSYSDLLSASWQRDDAAWQYIKIITSARLFTEEKNKKKGEKERKENFYLLFLLPSYPDTREYLFLLPVSKQLRFPPPYSPRQTFRCRTVNAESKVVKRAGIP